MTQHKHDVEQTLERLENFMSRGARSKKLLEILDEKVGLIGNSTVRQTAREDINELRALITRDQSFIGFVIEKLGL